MNPEVLQLQVQGVDDGGWTTVEVWPVWDESVRSKARDKLFILDALNIPARLGTAKDLRL